MVKPRGKCPSCGSIEFGEHLKFYAIQAIEPSNAKPDGRKMLAKMAVCVHCGLISLFAVTDDNNIVRYIDETA